LPGVDEMVFGDGNTVFYVSVPVGLNQEDDEWPVG
jgi:hypothetical protein